MTNSSLPRYRFIFLTKPPELRDCWYWLSYSAIQILMDAGWLPQLKQHILFKWGRQREDASPVGHRFWGEQKLCHSPNSLQLIYSHWSRWIHMAIPSVQGREKITRVGGLAVPSHNFVLFARQKRWINLWLVAQYVKHTHLLSGDKTNGQHWAPFLPRYHWTQLETKSFYHVSH